jgi:hypothetical protein
MSEVIQIKRASRARVPLKIGMSGPSGYGKTGSALLLAYGMTGDWDKIAVIDTENGSAALYAGSTIGGVKIPEFDTIELEAPFTPERYVSAIAALEATGKYEVIIVDSATHEWDGKGGCLEIVDSLGGKYQDWAKVTPRHRRFIDTILHTPCHFIVTMRTKQDYAVETDGKKTKVTKLGMKEVQREGTEYELTLNFNLTNDKHLAKASKDRTGLFMDRPEFVISVETGKELIEWNKLGKEPAPDYTVAKQRIATELNRLKINPKTMPDFKDRVRAITGMEWKDENLAAIAAKLASADLDDLPPPEGGASAGGNGTGSEQAPPPPENDVAAQFAAPAAPAPAPAAEVETGKAKMQVLNDYQAKFAAAKTDAEVDDILTQANTLDRDVFGSQMLTGAIAGLAKDRKAAIAAAPAPKEGDACADGKCGVCLSCIGAGISV